MTGIRIGRGRNVLEGEHPQQLGGELEEGALVLQGDQGAGVKD